MTYRVALSEQAKNDIKEIHFYIAKELFSPNGATKLTTRLMDAILSLDRFPESHPVFETASRMSCVLRVMSVGRYRVFFIVDDQKAAVFVIRVLYERRDAERELTKR